MAREPINHFSFISRLFGNLFYRRPTDPLLSDVFQWLQQQGLSQIWALETDKDSQAALDALQMPLDLALLDQEYQKLFGDGGKVRSEISAFSDLPAFLAFRDERNMPPAERADHVGLLLLTASWLEDNAASDLALRQLFGDFLLPVMAKFLTQTEKAAALPFYRSLALLTREILAAMADELDESGEE